VLPPAPAAPAGAADGEPAWWTQPAVGPAYDTGSDAWLRAGQPPAAPEPPVAAPEPPAGPAAAALAEALAAFGPPAAAVPPPADPPALSPVTAPAVPPVTAPHVLPVPARSHAGRTAPGRAVAGALVAVAGVLLGVGALLWVTDSPQAGPAVDQAQGTDLSSPPASAVPSAPVSPSAAATPGAVPATPAPLVRPASPAAVAPAPPPRLPLTVLNNSRRTGLADRATARFVAGGWPVKLTGNFTGQIPETTVYYAPGQQASALLLQRTFPGLTRVRPRFEGLPGSGLTVVLTRAYPDTTS
jgi:hypothetical protein